MEDCMIFDLARGAEKEKRITLQYVYNTFRGLCFERLMSIFIYDGCPFPSRELEYRYFKSGAVAIVRDTKAGTMATWASLNGVTVYDDVFTHVTYAAPTAKGGTLKIGDRAVVSYNNSLHQQLQSHVDIYASLLAHAYMSIKLALVNTRYQDILVSDNEHTRANIQAWYNGLYNGKPLAILHDSLIGISDSVTNLSPSNKANDIVNLINSYNELWRAFYRDIGIRFTKDKKANMVADEVNNDEQLLLYNIDDMLRQRKQLCEDYNELFVRKRHWETVEMSVKLNPIFDIIHETESKKEGVRDGENQYAE